METPGIDVLGSELVDRVHEEVQAFTPDNDPHGKHHYGSFDVDDRRGRFASPDPADPEKTLRVLTIILAEEY